MYIPVVTLNRTDKETFLEEYGPLGNRVRVEASDGNTYTGDLIKWTKKIIKIKLDNGETMKFVTD